VATKTALPSIIVVLGLKLESTTAVIDRTTAVVSGMEANPAFFPAPTPPLAQVKGHLADLSAAQAALKSRTGLRETRDEKQALVVADDRALHAYVQQVARANPAQAEHIAAAAAMSLKKVPTPQKKPLAVKSTVSGSAKVVAKATKGAHANEWQMSTDGGKTWSDLPTTLQASTTVHNLQVAQVVYFRQRPVLKTGVGDWSQAIAAVVT